jgi:lipopolysaccharide/colanic/teichoic acid biosynthesis glycosyltransferase
MKRIFDVISSGIGLIVLLPIFLIISVFIIFDSKGGIFYKQKRVGKYEKQFFLYKFRTMYSNSDKKGLLTIGAKDRRITKIGYYLRKYKLDELPQLINVFIGNMSLVGPRPEVQRYVDLYSHEQKKVLTLKPGITDYASLKYSNENEILAQFENAEKAYIERIMPDKLKINLVYVQKNNLGIDIKIIFLTIIKIFR